MAVTVTTGPLIVATNADATGAQYQGILPAMLSSANVPIQTGTAIPIIVTDPDQVATLRAMLVELCVMNESIYALTNTETEPLDMLRDKYRQILGSLIAP